MATKLKRAAGACKPERRRVPVKRGLMHACLAAFALQLSCSTPGPPTPPATGPAAVAPASGPRGGATHIGRPYDIDASASLLTIDVYRAGALARAGHNHVIASRELSGTVYVAADLSRSTCEVHIPVASFTVDEPQLRAREGADFPADVPEEARAGTRRNMLSTAVLSAESFPTIDLSCAGFVPKPAAEGSQSLELRLQTGIRGQSRMITVPLRYELAPDRLTAEGELPLKQTDLGITPFSAMLGALQVQDEMRVRIRLVAHSSPSKP
jgi:hypothetical protein